MIISHNIAAVNASRQLGIVGKQAAKTTEKLSSGYRINRAADDAAGLSISEKMRKQVRGLSRASENAQDGISLIQTAEGALNEVHDMLQRMNELAVQSANGTNSETDRGYIQDEVNQLKYEINRISTTVKFNETYLLDGSLGDPRKAGEVEKTYKAYMDEVDRKLFATELTGASKGKRVSLEDIHAYDGIKIIYAEITHDVETTQVGTGTPDPAFSGGSYETLKTTLQTEIVPQAVKALLDTYPQSFSYLKDSSIGIGLCLYYENSSTLASVTLGGKVWSDGTATPKAELTYKLSVNVKTLLNGGSTINLTPDIRNDLEVTIIHEMMHAMMDEVHTNGMLGFDGQKFDDGEEFPGWFKEGMAQTTAGGYYNGNDWVNGGLGITSSTSTTDIAASVRAVGKKLGSKTIVDGKEEETAISQYGTGYLACMYLGYLANGGGSVTQNGIKNGIDKILSELRGNGTTKGKSLNDVIKDNTKYNGISDFQNQFGDADSAAFIRTLTGIVGEGTGGLAADFQGVNDILPNEAPSPSIRLFALDPGVTEVKNEYPSGYPVMSGGGAYTNGTGVDGSAAGGTNPPSPPNPPTPPNPPDAGGGTGGVPTGPAWKEAAYKDGIKLQVSAESGERIMLYIEGMSCHQIGIQEVDVTTQDNATRAIDMIAFALDKVSSQRSILGAYQNRLERTIRNLDNVVENTQAAESKIRDTDMADEAVKHSNNQILLQAGQSVLAQTTQAADGVMRLLQ